MAHLSKSKSKSKVTTSRQTQKAASDKTFSKLDRSDWTPNRTSTDPQGQRSPRGIGMERWEKESMREQPFHAIGGVQVSAAAAAAGGAERRGESDISVPSDEVLPRL